MQKKIQDKMRRYWQGGIIPLPSGRTGWESGKLRKCETRIMGGYLL